MAEMFIRPAEGAIEYGCYSERGLMSYLMFVCLPKSRRLSDFLKLLKFPGNVPEQFSAVAANPEQVTLFSELNFGNEGFGCPDGAIYIHDPQPTMLFIETKLNESYVESCNITDEKKYNSTIQGQLELRWRLTHLYFNEPIQDNYVMETESLKKFYYKRDTFYHADSRQDPNKNGSWRRLEITEGVEYFLDKLKNCKNRIYFCAITNKDTSNPFDKGEGLQNKNEEVLLPKCYNMNWEDSKFQFCWMSADELIKFTELEISPNA